MNAYLLQLIIWALAYANHWSDEKWELFCERIDPLFVNVDQVDIDELNRIKKEFGIEYWRPFPRCGEEKYTVRVIER